MSYIRGLVVVWGFAFCWGVLAGVNLILLSFVFGADSMLLLVSVSVPGGLVELLACLWLYSLLGSNQGLEDAPLKVVPGAATIRASDVSEEPAWMSELFEEGRYAEALASAHAAVEFAFKHLGEDHPNFATSLNNLAELYRATGRYDQAEPLFQRAMEVRRKALGKDHPEFATSLINLAELYRSTGRYDQAEPLYLQAMEITRQALGRTTPTSPPA